MKKIVLITAVFALSLVLAGCGSQASSSSASTSASSSASAASASTTTASASSSSASASTVTWTKAASAAEAAKGAGIDELIVAKEGTKTSIGDLTKWEYCYAKDMAEADGGAGAAEIIIRKSVGSGDNTGELSDATASRTELKTMTFADEWDTNVDGATVHCYGSEEGKALKATWTDDKYSYSILALGQGDTWKEFGLPNDDIAILVKGTKKTESKQESKEASSAAASATADDTATDGSEPDAPGFDVEQAVWDNGLGEFVSFYYVAGGDGNDYWGVVTRGADGGEYTTYMDNAGNVVDDLEVGDVADDSGPGFNVEQVVWDNGLGEFISYSRVQGQDGDNWAVVTRGSDGEEYTTYLDDEGNVIG